MAGEPIPGTAMSEIIDQIVVLMEELANDKESPDRSGDKVRDLYGVHLGLSRAVGDRMGELDIEAKKAKAAEARAKQSPDPTAS